MTFGRIPIIPTIFVVVAAAVMVALGVWQLGRMDEKEALIARYAANEQRPVLRNFTAFSPGEVSLNEPHLERSLFRRVEIACDEPGAWKSVAGRSASNQAGYVHMFVCETFPSASPSDGEGQGPVLFATIGWSRSPQQPEWGGGTVTGILSTAGDDYEVVASEPFAGLQPLAKPDPSDLPNNHLAYAGQWFFFALTALVIYFLALRRRWRDADAEPK